MVILPAGFWHNQHKFKTMLIILGWRSAGNRLVLGFHEVLERFWYIQSTVELTRMPWLLQTVVSLHNLSVPKRANLGLNRVITGLGSRGWPIRSRTSSVVLSLRLSPVKTYQKLRGRHDLNSKW
jgi:hypothetical protein